MLQSIYRNYGLLGRPTELAIITVKDAGSSHGRRSRVKVYRFRRLPALPSEASEMIPLIEWLKQIRNQDALRLSWEDAVKVSVEAICSYSYASGRDVGYIGFPSGNSYSHPSRASGSPIVMDVTASPKVFPDESETERTPIEETHNPTVSPLRVGGERVNQSAGNLSRVLILTPIVKTLGEILQTLPTSMTEIGVLDASTSAGILRVVHRTAALPRNSCVRVKRKTLLYRRTLAVTFPMT